MRASTLRSSPAYDSRSCAVIRLNCSASALELVAGADVDLLVEVAGADAPAPSSSARIGRTIRAGSTRLADAETRAGEQQERGAA